MSDKGWRQFAEVLQHFCATDAFADHYRVRNIDPMYLGNANFWRGAARSDHALGMNNATGSRIPQQTVYFCSIYLRLP